MSGISSHYDTMVFIKDTIDALALDGLTGGTVIQEFPTYQDLKGNPLNLPFISIAPWGKEYVNNENGLTNRDGVDYPTIVIIFGAMVTGDAERLDALEKRLSWRQSIRRNLNNRSIPSLPLNFNLECKPGNIIELSLALDRKAFASSLMIIGKFQEPRS